MRERSSRQRGTGDRQRTAEQRALAYAAWEVDSGAAEDVSDDEAWRAGDCTPVDPADCPLAAVGGGPCVPGAAWHLTKSATGPGTWTDPADPGALEVPWTRRWEQWQCTDGTAHWTSPLGVGHQVRPRPVAQPAGPYRRVQAVPGESSALDRRPDRWRGPVLGPAGETDLSFPEHPDS